MSFFESLVLLLLAAILLLRRPALDSEPSPHDPPPGERDGKWRGPRA